MSSHVHDRHTQSAPQLVAAVRRAHGFSDVQVAGPVAPEVIEVALKHRVLPSLHRALVMARVEPDSRLREQLELEARRNLLRRSVMNIVLDRFSHKGIRALIYKGYALDTLYDDALRPAGDIDLVVESADLAGVREIGCSLSVHTEPSSPDSFSWSLNGVLIEIHTRLVESHIALLPDHSELFERSVVCPNAPGSWRTLAPDDHLLALLVHGFKHQWCRLGWILDIGLLKRQLCDDDLSRMKARACVHNVQRICDIGLELADVTLKGVPATDSIVPRYLERLFDPGESFIFKLENAALHLRCLEGLSARLRYINKRGASALRTVLPW